MSYSKPSDTSGKDSGLSQVEKLLEPAERVRNALTPMAKVGLAAGTSFPAVAYGNAYLAQGGLENLGAAGASAVAGVVLVYSAARDSSR